MEEEEEEGKSGKGGGGGREWGKEEKDMVWSKEWYNKWQRREIG